MQAASMELDALPAAGAGASSAAAAPTTSSTGNTSSSSDDVDAPNFGTCGVVGSVSRVR